MKKLLFLFTTLSLLTSCIEDDNPDFIFEIMPIQSVDVPLEFVLGETYEINVSYSRPNDCYEFSDFFVQNSSVIGGDNERTIAVINSVALDQTCNTTDDLVTVSFDFLVNNTNTYVFKFFQGQNSNGEDSFLIIEVPVVE
jgi:hypothetical protein